MQYRITGFGGVGGVGGDEGSGGVGWRGVSSLGNWSAGGGGVEALGFGAFAALLRALVDFFDFGFETR